MAELTVRAALLGAALSAVLAAANAYLGLFAGMTVSAAIPAAVVSMGLLRAVRGTILENNLVQTSASAGESVAAGAIFTLPALVLLGAWDEFDYLWTALLLGAGGVLGVLFTIPLRRALVIEAALPFPEGVATAEVLKAGHASGGAPGLALLAGGALGGGVAKLLEGGLFWTRAALEGAATVGGRVFAFGSSASPALLAVGAIVGFNVAVLLLVGGLVNWALVLPFVAELEPGKTPLEVAWITWSTKTRYLGVGAMTVGGLGAVLGMRRQLALSARSLWLALRAPRVQTQSVVGLEDGLALAAERDRDLSGRTLTLLFVGSVVALAVPFFALIGGAGWSVVALLLVVVTGFLFCAVAGYMAGLVGSSNNPVSGVTLATILVTSLVLLGLGMTSLAPAGGFSGPAAAVLVASAVCTAAAIGGDNMQDLKAGHLLGASPWRQQFVQLLGVLAAAFALPPVLDLLADVHGFGEPTAAHPRPLRAPQATLMAAVSSGVFGGALPWGFVLGGAALALVCALVDRALAHRDSKFRTPPLAVAVGLYLPLELSVPVAIGGIVAGLVNKVRGAAPEGGAGGALLLGAGLITGEALVGLGLAAWAGARGGAAHAVTEPSALTTWLVLGGGAAALYWAGLRFPKRT